MADFGDDRPLRRKYARVERERRFLLDRLPEGVDPGHYQRLRDCYVSGTNLRIRRVEAPDGAPIITKLGQKILDPDAPDDPRRRQMTTIYLTGAEADLLASRLDGRRLVKRRYKIAEQGWTFCIDMFEEPASVAGIFLAEVECDTDVELEAITCPPWSLREVTHEPQWSGARLASDD